MDLKSEELEAGGFTGLTLAVVGCGSMGSAILAGILTSTSRQLEEKESAAPISKFIACVQSQASAERLASTFAVSRDRLAILHNQNLRAFRHADVIVLACKPYMAQSILSEKGVQEALEGKLIISVLAGSTEAQLQSYISNFVPNCTITRAMPNMAAQIGESMTIISAGSPGSGSPPDHFPRFLKLTSWIFDQVGKTQLVSDEVYQAGAVLSGATPAWFTLAFDGILDGAVSEGIKRDVAKEVLTQSLLGTAKLLRNGEHPAVLREKISSPRGTTIQGLKTLEKGAVRSAFTDAFINSTQHGLNMK